MNVPEYSNKNASQDFGIHNTYDAPPQRADLHESRDGPENMSEKRLKRFFQAEENFLH